ncbi:MAG: ATP-binding cassette domain-containing protein, partial [Bdellovibrionales bacterium]|nr:ATP-binding cassette domain-containing protein [Bdellovibrionales bacterium]
MTQLTVRGIAKTFKTRKVVDGVSFQVQSGSVVGLLGPNGAGKTTSFYMVVGLVAADSGDILLGEQSISGLPMYQRALIGLIYLPQEASIIRRLTVTENILVALEAQGIGGSA